MKTLNVMLKPASSLCNMRCLYCFYADEAEKRAVPSYGMMTEETADTIIDRVSETLLAGDAVQYIFQGGEPTLRGLPFFERFAERAMAREDLRVSFSLQTNGLLLDDAFCDFFLKYNVLVGVSLDLLPECHDKARPDAKGEGTYTRVCEAISLLKRRGVPFNVLCTLTDAVAARPKQVWQRLLRLDVEYVQFTPCLGGEDGAPSYGALSPSLFADFYIRLFDLWYDDYKKGRVRSVKLFDDIVNLLILGRPTACGMDGVCRPQLVIEADGSAYPCDFYCTDAYRLGSIHEGIPALMTSEAWRSFATRERVRPTLCKVCRYARFCGGGCPKMQSEVYVSSDATACGYAKFLDACGASLRALAENAKKRCFGADKKGVKQ